MTKQVREWAAGAGALGLLFDTVVERSGTGLVVVDEQLRYVGVNSEAARINGHPIEAHIGRTLAEVVPDVAPTIEPAVRRVLATGRPELNIDTTGQTSATPGEKRWWVSSCVRLDVPGAPPRCYVAVVFTEVTDQRRSHERLRQVLDSLFTFVGVLEPDGTLLEANATALAAGGLDLDDVVGRPFWDASWWSHSPAARDRLRHAIVRAAAGDAVRYDTEMRVAGGGTITVDFQLAPIVDEGRVVALVPSALDITDRVVEVRRMEGLASLSAELNGTLDTAGITQAIIANSAAVEGATFANVALVDADAGCLRVVHPGDLDPDIQQRWTVIPLDLDPPTLLTDAVRTGRPVFVRDRHERADRYPHLLPESDRVGLVATAAVPLVDPNGQPFGVVGLGWAKPLDLDPVTLSAFELFADLCSQSLDRSRRTDAISSLVGRLQEELLADHDRVEGLDVAAAYRPATDSIGFGGDWHDVIALDDGSTAFVVGDVAGHGIPAAAQMAQVKGIVRALVANAADMGEVFAQATRALAPTGAEYVATVAVAVIDRVAGTLRLGSAGHPAAVLRAPDGSTELLWGDGQAPVGLARRRTTFTERPFAAGSVLLLYTDGLVERRDRGLDERMELLRAVLSDPGVGALDAAGVQALVLRELVDEAARDDVATIVIRNA